jgi:adenylate kinase family enzyme
VHTVERTVDRAVDRTRFHLRTRLHLECRGRERRVPKRRIYNEATRHMSRYVIFGNSGSGKSTLAARLARGGAHLDLDTLAWQPTEPPRRRAVADSARDLAPLLANDRWVIEGCYADLIEVALARCTRMVFLNPGVDACIANARARPWEPHKYPSKAAQDANLAMLVAWIRDYATRGDELSLGAHRALFERFDGAKVELASREAIAAFAG